MLLRAFIFLLLATGLASAAPLELEAASLKYLYSIKLDRNKDKVSGVFTRSEDGVYPAKYRFTGKLTQVADRVSKLDITFSPRDLKKGGSFPPTHQGTPWKLVESRRGPRLYVSVLVPVKYNASPSWKVSELEFEPVRFLKKR